MKRLLFGGESFVTGKDSLEYLKNITAKKAFIVAGSNSMMKNGVIGRIEALL